MTTYHPNGTVDMRDDDFGAPNEPHERGRTEKVRDAIGARARDMQSRGSDAQRELSDQVSRATEEGTRFVRENPGLALAGAVGIGVLIGLSMRSRW